MGQLSLKEAAEELQRIADRRSRPMQELDETREAFRRRIEDLIYQAYGVRATATSADAKRREP